MQRAGGYVFFYLIWPKLALMLTPTHNSPTYVCRFPIWWRTYLLLGFVLCVAGTHDQEFKIISWLRLGFTIAKTSLQTESNLFCICGLVCLLFTHAMMPPQQFVGSYRILTSQSRMKCHRGKSHLKPMQLKCFDWIRCILERSQICVIVQYVHFL